MNTDLTIFWDSAHRSTRRWSQTEALAILSELLRTNPGANIDWDMGAGEKWGRVVRDDQALALVAVDVPVVIVHASVVWDRSFLDEMGAHVLVVEDMSRCEFSFDATNFRSWFGRDVSSAIDLDSFSIDELWWATV
jgi:hypothetical protein